MPLRWDGGIFPTTRKVRQADKQFRVFNSPAPEGATWHNVTVVFCAADGSVWSNSGNMKFFFRNQSGYQMMEWDYDFNFSDYYVVEIKLVYSETYAPVAASRSDLNQIAIFDGNFEPVLVGLESSKIIA